jgi:hypothetical protein
MILSLPTDHQGFYKRTLTEAGDLCWTTSEGGLIEVDIYAAEGARRMIERAEMKTLAEEIDRARDALY